MRNVFIRFWTLSHLENCLYISYKHEYIVYSLVSKIIFSPKWRCDVRYQYQFFKYSIYLYSVTTL
jgi:hypothetical protein